MATYRAGIVFRDAEGFTGDLAYWITGANTGAAATAANTVNAAAEACSNGAVVGGVGINAVAVSPDAYGAAADYLSCTFRAEFRFLTSAGEQIVIGVPSPKRSIFAADGQTIDEANGDAAGFIAAVLANGVSSRQGTLLTGSLRGKLVKRAFRRKMTVWSFASDLTTPDE